MAGLTPYGWSLMAGPAMGLPKDWWEPKVLVTLDLPADLLAQLLVWQRVLVSIDAELQAGMTPYGWPGLCLVHASARDAG